MADRNENFINTGELGRAIKRRREELGLSLRDVADVTNVSASTLSRIENGTGKPDADNIARLTGWLDMPIDLRLGAGWVDVKNLDNVPGARREEWFLQGSLSLNWSRWLEGTGTPAER